MQTTQITQAAYATQPMLMQSRWIFTLRGAIAILLGLFALAMPGMTLLSLTVLFAVYAVLGGAVALAGAIRHRRTDRDWWALLLLGLVSIAAGVLATIYPVMTALVLVMLIGANALVSGVLDLVLAVRLRQHARGAWMLILSGLVSLVFGALVLIYPGAGALALIWMIAVYALATGVLYLILAFHGPRTARRLDAPAGAPRSTDLPAAAPAGVQRRSAERRFGDRRLAPLSRERPPP
ncbi:MAG TPA: HdeD family acid-resistance protein [Janthinobacterium sp.]|nr:HdeD family acid-resistance protein [Janthinobacterium sp.]